LTSNTCEHSDGWARMGQRYRRPSVLFSRRINHEWTETDATADVFEHQT